MLRTLDRQRLAHKLLLVALLALLMLAVPGALTLQDHLGELRLAHERQTGLAPASAVLDLVRQTQKHRGMSAGALAGSATLETQRQALAKELEKSQQTLQERLASLGLPALQQQARQRRDDWQALQDAVAARKLEGPQSFARHTALIAGQLELLDDIALATGLARDTDPVDHALESLAMGALPALSEGLGQARARGSALLAKGSASADELARFDDLVNRVARDRHQVERVLARLDGLDPALVAGLAEARKPAVAALEQARVLIDEKIVKAQTFSHPAPEYFASMTQVIDRLFVLADAVFARHQQRLQAEAAAARNDLLALAGGLLALGGLAGWLMWHVTRSTTRSLNQAVQIARAVAEGRLGDAADHRGATRAGAGAAANDHSEVTQLMVALDDMATRLTEVVSGVRRSADGVAQASREIAQGNMDLSNRTEQQAAALEQTAATMDELGSTVRHNAENAGQAAQLAQGAREVAQRGSTAVHEVITTMKAIADSARQIERINGTIDGIAFQTNILALNASVEAARAGEQGRGFAVVAGEVRHLAQRAAEAAREIKQLIATSQESVDQGSRQVDEAGATMTEVVQAIHHVSDIVEEISQASREQSTGVQQVGQAVTQMDQTTQQNAALVEEGAAAAGSLESQARQLAEMVSVFDLARHGVAG